MMTEGRTTGLVWATIAMVVAFLSIRVGVWGTYGPDSGFFPLLSAFFMGGGAVYLLVESNKTKINLLWPKNRGWFNIFITASLLFFTAYISEYIGLFIPATITTTFLLSMGNKWRWRSAIPIGIISSSIIYFVFLKILGMHLPRGPLGI